MPGREATVEFGLDEWRDVDLVDGEVLHVAVNIDVDEIGATHHDAAEIHAAEVGTGEVDASKRRAREIHVLELCAGKIDVAKVGHGLRLGGE